MSANTLHAELISKAFLRGMDERRMEDLDFELLKQGNKLEALDSKILQYDELIRIERSKGIFNQDQEKLRRLVFKVMRTLKRKKAIQNTMSGIDKLQMKISKRMAFEEGAQL